MSARGRSGPAAAASEPRPLASMSARPVAAPELPSASTGGQSGARPGHGGAQPSTPLTGQGGGVAQAVAGAGAGAGLAMMLVLVLLAWLASFARRLQPPRGVARDVRLLLILDRPG